METIRAVNHMAIADADGASASRTPGGADLNRRQPNLHKAVENSIRILVETGMRPDEDRATQFRLAAAIDRIAAAPAADLGHEGGDGTRRILSDYMLQEAAAARLAGSDGVDPLAHLSSAESGRSALNASGILSRQGIHAQAIFDRASHDDLTAIASGRFDRIESEHTRFSVGAQLRLDGAAMQTQTMAVPRSPGAIDAIAPHYEGSLATGVGKGPKAPVQPMGFGRKGVVER